MFLSEDLNFFLQSSSYRNWGGQIDIGSAASYINISTFEVSRAMDKLAQVSVKRSKQILMFVH